MRTIFTESKSSEQDLKSWPNPEILIVGETLFDCIEKGPTVLGGAPCNVAWNLTALGAPPHFITAVGDDELGQKASCLLSDMGLNTNFVQVVSDKKTGIVNILTNNGIPFYDIIEDCAYDYLKLPLLSDQVTNGVLYHGSLAFRQPVSRSMLNDLKEMWTGQVFVDVNIRVPWFDLNDFSKHLSGIDYLKLNDEELNVLVDDAKGKSTLDQMDILMNRYGVKNIILTAGKRGAYWFSGNELLHAEADPSIMINDTIGAGDAFASVCLIGIRNHWDPQETLTKASRFAEQVCTNTGATTDNKNFYEKSKRELYRAIEKI